MDHSKKRDYRARKFASAHQYQGRRRKPKRKATVEECESPAGRPNQGRGDTAACGNFDEIDAAIKFVAGSVNGVICDVGALTAMVSRAVCPTCRTAGLVVRDAASKRKGLSSFLELYCDNSECPESVLSAAHSSRRVVREGDAIGAGEDQDRSYRSGSSRDNFAVNVKENLKRLVGRLKHTLNKVVEWANDAWYGLPPNMVCAAFPTYGNSPPALPPTATTHSDCNRRLTLWQ
ncbi:hypothetical protein HPB50_017609 [Hyalomma asiaticum]|uniref:Uncharacterized protein n=1 Tax=Hyalomma asiaticum TaxID=266040 RepID=A0ACB7TM48_HYAAI|nr:hypothetical protein HPB50_017609 [Hyalomma asiaticum]